MYIFLPLFHWHPCHPELGCSWITFFTHSLAHPTPLSALVCEALTSLWESMRRHGPCVLFRHKALLFSWSGGLHVGESQLWCYCLFSSGAIGYTTLCFQRESRQECALTGTWTSLVLYKSWRATKWHEATLLKSTVFNEQHCGLLLWWLVGRLELYGWYKSLSCVSNA